MGYRFSTRWFFLATMLATTLPPSLGQAQAPEINELDKAGALAQEAKSAFDSGDFLTALSLYTRADKIIHTLPLMLGIARSQAKLMRLLDARATYEKILQDGAPPDAPAVVLDALVTAKTERDELNARIPSIIILLKGPSNAAVTLNGVALSADELGKKRQVDPGSYTAEVAQSEGFYAAKSVVTVAEGSNKELNLAPRPKVAPPPPDADGDHIPDKDDACPDEAGVTSTDPKKNGCELRPPPPPASIAGIPRRTLTLASLGVGGAGLLLGSITGLATLSKSSDLEGKCTDHRCPSSERDAVNSYGTLRTVSTVGFVVAGLGLGAGAVLWLTTPKSNETGSNTRARRPSLGAFVGPSSLGLLGRF